jgi:hypothetical protein
LVHWKCLNEKMGGHSTLSTPLGMWPRPDWDVIPTKFIKISWFFTYMPS